MKKELKILIGILVIFIVGFAVAAQLYKSVNTLTSTPASSAGSLGNISALSAVDERLVRPDSPTLGPENAAVTLVEFLDPECESCRAFFPVVKRILTEYDGRIRLVVRYMPFHSNSILAAQATEAAGAQGKYWEMQELLFAKQGEWGHNSEPQRELMIKYAKELGLDVEKFQASLSNMLVFTKLERDRQDGVALGVNGTPTFFVNGQRLENLSYDALKEAIDSILKASK
jgi:protein-disulfide isomerase